MEESAHSPRVTYGGEVEVLVVRRDTGSVTPLEETLRVKVQNALTDMGDLYECPVNVGYDSTEHLVEMRGGVHAELVSLLSALQMAFCHLCKTLDEEGKKSLLSSSYHPLDDIQAAYKHVLPRPMYSLMKGALDGKGHMRPDVLSRIYPTSPEAGRGWQHEATGLAAAIQPWNSLDPQHAADQIAILQTTGWLFNLLTANSPFKEGRWTGKRDYRLEIWPALVSTSRYEQDASLVKNLPARPKQLVDYYRYIFCNQRLAAIPYTTAADSPVKDGKTAFMAIIQPDDRCEFNTLTYLQADRIKVINSENASIYEVRPSVAHIFNNFDFFYLPRYGARLRINLPRAERIDPKAFAQAIIEGDEATLQALLIEGGIHEGFICAEGRTAATVFPTRDRPGWERFNIAFVLQAAILRSYQEICDLFKDTPFTWHDLTETLPEISNNAEYGFTGNLKGISITKLAQSVWAIAQKYITPEEHTLVGEEIDRILSTQKAPAEEQIAFIKKIWDISGGNPFPLLIDYLTVADVSLPVTHMDDHL